METAGYGEYVQWCGGTGPQGRLPRDRSMRVNGGGGTAARVAFGSRGRPGSMPHARRIISLGADCLAAFVPDSFTVSDDDGFILVAKLDQGRLDRLKLRE